MLESYARSEAREEDEKRGSPHSDHFETQKLVDNDASNAGENVVKWNSWNVRCKLVKEA